MTDQETRLARQKMGWFYHVPSLMLLAILLAALIGAAR